MAWMFLKCPIENNLAGLMRNVEILLITNHHLAEANGLVEGVNNDEPNSSVN